MQKKINPRQREALEGLIFGITGVIRREVSLQKKINPRQREALEGTTHDITSRWKVYSFRDYWRDPQWGILAKENKSPPALRAGGNNPRHHFALEGTTHDITSRWKGLIFGITGVIHSGVSLQKKINPRQREALEGLILGLLM